jgi:hypothetical protein
MWSNFCDPSTTSAPPKKVIIQCFVVENRRFSACKATAETLMPYSCDPPHHRTRWCGGLWTQTSCFQKKKDQKQCFF